MIKKINILLPVYNEGQSIYNLLCEYAAFLSSDSEIQHSIIVVNDCSYDETEYFIRKSIEEFNNLNIIYKKNETNKGLHGILKDELFELANNISDDEVIVTMDGDNTHNPFLIKNMLDKINQGADIAIASRYCSQSRIKGLSPFRILLSSGSRYLYSIRWNIKGVKDYTSNFRAYRAVFIKDLIKDYGKDFVKEKGFTAVAELLKNLKSYKPIIVEVPMILNYSNKLEISNMRIATTVIKTIKMLFNK